MYIFTNQTSFVLHLLSRTQPTGFTFDNNCGWLQSAWQVSNGGLQDSIFDPLVDLVGCESQHGQSSPNPDGQRSFHQNGHVLEIGGKWGWGCRCSRQHRLFGHTQAAVLAEVTKCGSASQNCTKPGSKLAKQIGWGTGSRKFSFAQRSTIRTGFENKQARLWGIFIKCKIVDRFSQIADIFLKWWRHYHFIFGDARNQRSLL